jgi:hypothetical protein
MKRPTLTAALCLAALGLTACNNTAGGMAANSKVCVDWKQAKPATLVAGAEGAGPLDECVKRWAYTLSSSADDAGTVAEAAAQACNVQLSRWNQASLNQPGGDQEATSITTGETTTPLAEHNAFSRGRALFYVVQARAGHCAAPPIKDGVPEGIS